MSKLKTFGEKKKHGTRFEHSAGGVVYQRRNSNVEILLLQDRNGVWSFPKGLIEYGESAITTAMREIAEEVGIDNLTFTQKLDTIGYFYRFEGRLIRKQVDFFLFEYKGNEKPVPLTAEGIQQAQWFTPEKALANIGYVETNKPILEKAISLLKMTA